MVPYNKKLLTCICIAAKSQYYQKIDINGLKISVYYNYYYHGKYNTTACTKKSAQHIADEKLAIYIDRITKFIIDILPKSIFCVGITHTDHN